MRPRSVGELFALNARKYGARLAWRAPNGDRTHSEIHDNGRRVAGLLHEAGLGVGDRVMIMLDDIAQAMEIFAGIQMAGMVVVPANRAFKSGELDFMLTDSGARGLFFSDGARNTVMSSEVAARLDLSVFVDAGEPDVTPQYLPPGAVAPRPIPVPDIEAPAIIAYTSGTTGYPKGAIASHRAVLLCLYSSRSTFRVSDHGHLAYSGTLQFAAPWAALLIPHLYSGGFIRLMGKYNPESWFEFMRADLSTMTYVPTPLIPDFIEVGRQHPDVIARLHCVLHSASGAPAERIESLVDLVGDKFVEGYGLTETVGGGCATAPADYHPGCLADDIYASVGRPQPSTFARVLDDDGQDIAPGSDQVGEVQYECETLFSGYWNRPEETAEVFDGTAFLTGDLARRDAAGYVYVVGRKKELIISGGQNIYPAELERVLAAMDGVAQCAIFGVDHPRWGEAVAAAVVRKPEASVDEQAVVDYMRGRLASYKKPTQVLILDALPMNAGMKVQKGRLREIANQLSRPDSAR